MFKRALFTTEKPVVIFLTAEKLGDPFESGKCYPIFGPDEPMEIALEKYPMALCVGYDRSMESPTRRELDRDIREERNDPDYIKTVLLEMGFEPLCVEAPGNTGAIARRQCVVPKVTAGRLGIPAPTRRWSAPISRSRSSRGEG